MIRYLILLLLFSVGAQAATVKLQWDANTETDLAGYTVYNSRTSDLMMPRRAADTVSTSVTFSNISAGRPYYFVVTARNTAGLESAYSNVVFFNIPKNPTSLQLIINQLIIQ